MSKFVRTSFRSSNYLSGFSPLMGLGDSVSESEDQASLGQILGAFLTASREHWKELVGGSFAAILIGVALTMGLNIPRSIAGLIAFCLAVLLACFLAFRDQYRKTERLEAIMKPRILVSGGRSVGKSIIHTSDGFTYFRARMDLIGVTPVCNIEAHITEIRKDGHDFPLDEEARLMLHPGVVMLATLKEGVAGFVDVIKTDSNGQPLLALAWNYASVDPYIFASGDTHHIDISITADSMRTIKITFVFSWSGHPLTSEFEMLKIHIPPRLG